MMDYQVATNKISQLMQRLKWSACMIAILLMANVLLALFSGYALTHPVTRIIPVGMNKTVTFRGDNVDSNYLVMMSVMFLQQKLSFTPQTILDQQTMLLHYLDPSFYSEFRRVLLKERKAVLSQNISSVFYVTSIKPNLASLTVEVKGQLKRWVGSLVMPEVTRHYQLSFKNRDGRLFIHAFRRIEESANA